MIALLSITALTPVLGGFFGFLIPLAVVLFILIILHPYAPKVLNNVGFAYLTVACIDTTALATHLPQFFITFIVGSVLFNGVCAADEARQGSSRQERPEGKRLISFL